MARLNFALSNASRKGARTASPRARGRRDGEAASLSGLLVLLVTKVRPAGRRPKSLEQSSKENFCNNRSFCFANLQRVILKSLETKCLKKNLRGRAAPGVGFPLGVMRDLISPPSSVILRRERAEESHTPCLGREASIFKKDSLVEPPQKIRFAYFPGAPDGSWHAEGVTEGL